MTIPHQANYEEYSSRLNESVQEARNKTPLKPTAATVVILRALNHEDTKQILVQKYGEETTQQAQKGYKDMLFALMTDQSRELQQAETLRAHLHAMRMKEEAVSTTPLGARYRENIRSIEADIAAAERHAKRAELPKLSPEILDVSIAALEHLSMEDTPEGLEAWDVLMHPDYPLNFTMQQGGDQPGTQASAA